MWIIGLCLSLFLMVLTSCSQQPDGPDALETQVRDDSIRGLMTKRVPSGFSLINVSTKATDGAGLEAVTSFYQSGSMVVSVCAAVSLTLPDEECLGSTSQLTVDRVVGPVVAAAECVSEICEGFNERQWLDGFGEVEPSIEATLATITSEP